jgi:type VI secretion system secreted protein Hcp
MAQVDYFLKIAGIEGESADDKHKGEFDLDSFVWSEAQPGGAPAGGVAGGGASAAKIQPQDLQFVKRLDKASPVLMIGCATGKHYRSAVLTARKAGAGQQDYFKLVMQDVTITSYQVGGSTQPDLQPIDQVSLRFARLEMTYREQKADGSLGAEVTEKFDFKAKRQA